jgi:hypothetical protein
VIIMLTKRMRYLWIFALAALMAGCAGATPESRHNDGNKAISDGDYDTALSA